VTALDVVGVGALNLDYIARTSSAQLRPVLSRFGLTLDRGTERRVDEAVIRAAIDALGSVQIDTVMGGSAFNTIHAMSRMKSGLRLGYVGVAGRGVSSVRLFASLGIDRRFVFREDDHLCGICFSFSEDGDRTLLTHEGANQFMADYLDKHFDELVGYLADSRIVHVTSFLDERTIARLYPLLQSVKRANPATLISFDPGHAWSTSGHPEVRRLAELSDILLVNRREFTALALDHSTRATMVVKHPDGIQIGDDFFAQVPLPDDKIVDGTGAGDVFAAGLLSSLARDPSSFEPGARLGMQLARHKLLHTGTDGHADFPAIASAFG
jgi:sugar/nucleoside kinase (ribokinase family)